MIWLDFFLKNDRAVVYLVFLLQSIPEALVINRLVVLTDLVRLNKGLSKRGVVLKLPSI